MRKKVRDLYIRFIRSKIKNEISRQRLKFLLWDMYPYFTQLHQIRNLSFSKKLSVVRKFCKADWHVVHAHKPVEIMAIWQQLDAMNKSLDPKEKNFVEAGCYNGGTSVKFSLFTSAYGWKLRTYDSFEGVEEARSEEGSTDFSGSYAASMESVRANISKYGDISNTELIKGWFKDSFQNIDYIPSIIYIDCDLLSGTKEVLLGCAPKFTSNTAVFSQDYHIRSVRNFLEDSNSWKQMGLEMPAIKQIDYKTAKLTWS